MSWRMASTVGQVGRTTLQEQGGGRAPLSAWTQLLGGLAITPSRWFSPTLFVSIYMTFTKRQNSDSDIVMRTDQWLLWVRRGEGVTTSGQHKGMCLFLVNLFVWSHYKAFGSLSSPIRHSIWSSSSGSVESQPLDCQEVCIKEFSQW